MELFITSPLQPPPPSLWEFMTCADFFQMYESARDESVHLGLCLSFERRDLMGVGGKAVRRPGGEHPRRGKRICVCMWGGCEKEVGWLNEAVCNLCHRHTMWPWSCFLRLASRVYENHSIEAGQRLADVFLTGVCASVATPPNSSPLPPLEKDRQEVWRGTVSKPSLVSCPLPLRSPSSFCNLGSGRSRRTEMAPSAHLLPDATASVALAYRPALNQATCLFGRDVKIHACMRFV